MLIVVEGANPPGRNCRPGPAGEAYENIHVGMGHRAAPFGLVPGDTPSPRWQLEIRTVRLADGTIDYRGQFVEGERGARFLYLNWGTVSPDGAFHLFRRAKLSLSEIAPTLIGQAM